LAVYAKPIDTLIVVQMQTLITNISGTNWILTNGKQHYYPQILQH